MQKWERDGDSRCYENGGPCTFITTSHFTKSKKRTAHLHAMQNKFWILSAYLTSCWPVMFKCRETQFWFPRTTKIFTFDTFYMGKPELQSAEAWPLSLPLERIHSCMLEYFCASLQRNIFHFILSYCAFTQALKVLEWVRLEVQCTSKEETEWLNTNQT